MSTNLSLIVSSESSNDSRMDKKASIADYQKKLEFIKTSLDMSEDKLSKKKVTELPSLLEQAQHELTVGKMNKLLKKETPKVSLIELAVYKVGKLFNRKHHY